MTAIADHFRSNRDTHLEQLQELLRIPSISTDPERAGDVRRAAARDILRHRPPDQGGIVDRAHPEVQLDG